MPLAHPTSIVSTNNYSLPCVAIAFATSQPGEDVDEFQARIAEVGTWGQSNVGRDKVELVLTEESVAELVKMLLPVVGRSSLR